MNSIDLGWPGTVVQLSGQTALTATENWIELQNAGRGPWAETETRSQNIPHNGSRLHGWFQPQSTNEMPMSQITEFIDMHSTGDHR